MVIDSLEGWLRGREWNTLSPAYEASDLPAVPTHRRIILW